jgi:hypothetical protein
LNSNFNDNKIKNNNIILIALVAFHHKKGSIVEYTYPPKEDIIKNNKDFIEELINFNECKFKNSEDALEDILNQLTFLCLPDMVHTTNEDEQFFFIQNFKNIIFGTSCYKQVKTSSIELDNENTRNCVQKAICIVSKFPLFAQMYSKLNTTLSVFFSQITLKDKNVNFFLIKFFLNLITYKIIEDLYSDLDSLCYKNININEIFINFSTRKLLYFCKDKIFSILKFMFLEKKILIYSQTSNHVCAFILALLSLLPGSWIFNMGEIESIKAYKVKKK